MTGHVPQYLPKQSGGLHNQHSAAVITTAGIVGPEVVDGGGVMRLGEISAGVGNLGPSFATVHYHKLPCHHLLSGRQWRGVGVDNRD